MKSDGTMTWYEYQKMQQRCTGCGTRDAYTISGRALCAECAEKSREKYRRNAQKRIRQVVEYQKCRRKRWEESGLCTVCGKYTPKDGYKMCERCLEKSSQYAKKRVKPLIPGICSRCRSNPVLEGHKLCAVCYEDVCKGLEKARAVSQERNGGHVWRKYWEERNEISDNIPCEDADARG